MTGTAVGTVGRAMICEEGCGCRFERRNAFVQLIDAEEHFFCCSDCADEFQETLVPEVTRSLRELVTLGQSVADIGCGSGYYTALLRDLVGPGGRVYATDPAAGRVAQSKRHLVCRVGEEAIGWVRFLRTTTSLPDASLDFVLSNNVLCCMNDRTAAVRELARLLRPGGRVYVRVSEMRASGATPIDDREWMGLFTSWTLLREGTSGTARWKVMVAPVDSRAGGTPSPSTPPSTRTRVTRALGPVTVARSSQSTRRRSGRRSRYRFSRLYGPGVDQIADTTCRPVGIRGSEGGSGGGSEAPLATSIRTASL